VRAGNGRPPAHAGGVLQGVGARTVCLVHRNDHDWATPIHGTWSGELLQHPARFLEVVQPQHGEAIPLGAGMRRKVVRVSGGRLFPGGFCGAFERCASGMAMAMKQRSLDYTNFEERRR
jgi:hypothetical protein